MKIYYPKYYDGFSCLKGECPDSCCKSWEIVIDEKTYERYSEFGGILGEKIRNNITTDDDGDKCFRLTDGRCPFLNIHGLCDIHIESGEEFTSEICRVHPRFIEEYDGFTEISLSLSCPAAAKLIVSSDYSVFSEYPVPVTQTDDEVLTVLIGSRAEVLSEKKPLFECVRDFTAVAARDEADINLCYVEEGFVPDVSAVKTYIQKHLSACEVLCNSWVELLENAKKSEISDEKFQRFICDNDKEICNIFYYYVYRYYLKAVNDLDIYTRALFIIFSVFASALIADANNLTVEEAARLYSKEIEHSTKNIDIITENLCEY